MSFEHLETRPRLGGARRRDLPGRANDDRCVLAFLVVVRDVLTDRALSSPQMV